MNICFFGVRLAQPIWESSLLFMVPYFDVMNGYEGWLGTLLALLCSEAKQETENDQAPVNTRIFSWILGTVFVYAGATLPKRWSTGCLLKGNQQAVGSKMVTWLWFWGTKRSMVPTVVGTLSIFCVFRSAHFSRGGAKSHVFATRPRVSTTQPRSLVRIGLNCW